MSRQVLALVIGALITITTAQAAQGAQVTVRVEGATTTLVPRTTVTLPSAAPAPDGTNPCAAASVGGALWAATGGAWGGPYYAGFGDYGLQTIRGETHTFADADGITYYVYRNGAAAYGTCTEPAADGDDILVAACPADAGYDCAWPRLVVSAPATASPAGVTVTVRRLAADGVTKTPEAGVTVTGGTSTAITDAAGLATISPSGRGPLTIRATKDAFVRDAASTCVTDGADGYCGTAVAPGAEAPPADAVTGTGTDCATNGRDGRCGTGDTTQPWSRVTAPAHGARFARGMAPRTLSGTVEADGTGIAKIELRLTRRAGRTCQTYSDKRERWIGVRRCGAARGAWFSVGAGQAWRYLLPAALPAGRYVLDVRVTDGAGNVSVLARTYTRSVFTVA